MSRTKVLTVRLSESEYEALSGLSVVEDKAMSALIRIAIGEHVRRVVSDTAEYERKTALARERAEKARQDLLQHIGQPDPAPVS